MSLEVIGAGLGRTGTMSLKSALETLGFGPCYHMTEVFDNLEHIPVWEAATRGEDVDWERIFSRYRAAVDYPVASFYKRLMERYPDAKVILSVRKPERWYESARNTIYRASEAARLPLIFVLARLVPRLRGMKRTISMNDDLIWKQSFDGRFEDREYAMDVFRRHNEEAKRHVPAEKLLVYEVKEGWGPLCDFLGVPVPDEPFPRLNDTAEFQRRIRILKTVSAAAVVLPAAVVAYLLFRRARRHVA